VNHQPDTSNRSTVREFQARTTNPLPAFPLRGEGKGRVIPGGALVTVHENVTHGLYTATAYMGGEPYEAGIGPNQFVPYHQNTNAKDHQ
jgi:hypothetical protein